MHFKIAKSAQSYFNNIMNLEGSHAAEDKNKFIQFDVYYCCALIGMAAGQIDEDTSELKDLVEKYPVQYRDCKAQIAGLLVASEARRLGIDTQSPKLEQIMLQYLSNNDTLLSEDGIKTLNAYALKGYRLITDYPLFDKPTSREEFLDAFNVAMQFYEKKDIWTGCMSTKIIRGKALHLRSATNWSALQPERRSQRTPPLRQSLFSCIADTASCASRK